MHIVINGRFLSQATTGVQRYAREVVSVLDRQLAGQSDLTIELLVPRGVAPPRYANIVVRPVGRLAGHLWEQIELPFHARGDVLFCPGNTAPILSLVAGPAVVATVHDLSYRYFPSAYSRAFRLTYNILMPVVLRLATRLITVSHAERAQMLRLYPGIADRLDVVPNGGMPALAVARAEAIPPTRPYALYVGSFSRRKNFDMVMAVATRLVTERPEYDFVFVGDRSKIFEPHLPSDPASTARMKFTGQVDSLDRLAGYYSGASAFLFPSLYESSGLPPIEAMACGCPVVSSDIPALLERCGDAAVYCDPTDAESVYAALLTVLDDPARAQGLRRAGLARAEAFTWEACAAKTLASIRAIPPHASRRAPVSIETGGVGKSAL